MSFWLQNKILSRSLILEDLDDLKNLSSNEISFVVSNSTLSELSYFFNYLILNSDEYLDLVINHLSDEIELSFSSKLKLASYTFYTGKVSDSLHLLLKLYKILINKNLLNKCSELFELRKKLGPNHIDFLFLELKFFEQNDLVDEAFRTFNIIDEKLNQNLRILYRTKTKEEYKEKIFKFLNENKDKRSFFFEKAIMLKDNFSKKDMIALLILTEGREDKIVNLKHKFSQKYQDKIDEVYQKKIRPNVQKIEVKPFVKEIDQEQIDEICYKRDISENEREKLFSKYLMEVTNDEKELILSIKAGAFDHIERKDDLLISFYNLKFFKAMRVFTIKDKSPLTLITYAEIMLSLKKMKEAREVAYEVILNKDINDLYLDRAKRIVDICE